MARTQKRAIEDFIAAITAACNEYGILYADSIYQEDLFEFQDKFINALVSANRNKLITNEEMIRFEHIFHIENEKN